MAETEPSPFQHLKRLYESALNMPNEDASKPLFLRSVGSQCFLANQQIQSLEVYDISISSFQLAIDLTPPDNQELLISLFSFLGETFMHRYELSRNVEDLDHAISTMEKSVSLTPEHGQSLPDKLSNLGYALQNRFHQTENLEDIDKAIELHRTAASRLAPEGDQSRLINLSTSLQYRFDRIHNSNDIDEAIEVNQKLIDSMDENDPQYCRSLTNFVSAFMTRFSRTGDLTDIGKAIEMQHKAVDLTPNDHPDLPGFLANLGTTYQSYFIRTGELSHIHLAIEFQRRALELGSSGDHLLADFAINLGVSLAYRFLSTGNLDDLEEAIALEQRGIQICRDDDLRLRRFYSDLGNLFYYRTSFTHDERDILEGAQAHREAVVRTPPGHGDLPGFLNNLGNSLKRVYSITNNTTDLSEAIACYQQAVDMTADGDIEMMNRLNNLGGALRSRYFLTHQQRDLYDALDAHRASVSLCPPNHAKLPDNLYNLADALKTLFEREHQLEIMDEAISLVEQSIDITPEEHVRLPSLFDKLASLFFVRYNETKNIEDVEKAVTLYRQATLIPIGSPSLRLHSGKLWGTLSLMTDPEQALEAFETIFNDIVPQLAWIGRTMEQRYTLLTRLADTVSEATAVAIQYGQIHLALEWLEQGRSIVWNQVNSFRTPLDDLREKEPSLCREVEDTGNALQAASMRTDSSDLSLESITHKVSLQTNVRRHQDLAKHWDCLLAKVRGIDGFERFLRPVPFVGLVKALPASGLVIIVNADPFSCDAFILTRGMTVDWADLFTVRLPKFYERANTLRERLHGLLSDPAARTRSTRAGRPARTVQMQFSIRDILRELWYEIVKPIIDALSLNPTLDPPRVWWCPTGPLAFLPLHAAGDYNNPTFGSNITDYAVSSYTPTLTTLTQSISKHNQRQKQDFKGLLIVSEPKAPNLPTIPSTTQENHILKHIFEGSSLPFLSLHSDEATVENVSQAMPSSSWIHLSCHALQNDSPLKSAFYLHDGQLSLGEIIKQRLPHSQFAYLSACETGKGDKKLSEEAIHLAAGMLAAGYASVVATMWSISDVHAPFVAETFYSNVLQREGCDEEEWYPDCTRTAEGLHHAIRRFRDKVGDDEEGLLLWVPYIHVGI